MKSLLLCFSLLLVLSNSFASATLPQELGWQDLMPKGWQPTPQMTDHSSAFLDDNGDSNEALSPVAPVVNVLDNRYVRIPGFILPLTFKDNALTEFLLVPYIGACLHVPPPPSNQVVFVKLKEPISGTDLYEPVWIEGKMLIEPTQSKYADAGYSITADKVEKYIWE